MRFLRLSLAILLTYLISNLLQAQQNVGIGTTTPNSSAMLDIVSTTKGVLIPRAETSAISSPVAGLIVYQPSDNSVYYHMGDRQSFWGRQVFHGPLADAGARESTVNKIEMLCRAAMDRVSTEHFNLSGNA